MLTCFLGCTQHLYGLQAFPGPVMPIGIDFRIVVPVALYDET